MPTPESISGQLKRKVPDMRYLFFSCQEVSIDSPTQKLNTIVSFIILQNTIEDAIDEDTIYLNHGMWINKASSNMEASFLLASFHSDRSLCA